MHPDTMVAEALPRIYRRIIDAVARLEAHGARRDAARLRGAAIDAYARPWDDRCRRRLEEIASRAESLATDAEERPVRVA